MHKWQIFFWLAPRPALAGKSSIYIYGGEARDKKKADLNFVARIETKRSTEYVIETL